MSDLKIWSDGTDWCIAESAEHAARIRSAHYEHDNDIDGNWRQVASPDPMTIAEMDPEPGTRSIAQWIADKGPGFLCSTEY